MYGIDAGKMTLIVTDYPHEIAAKIDEYTGRGATFLRGRGSYSKAVSYTHLEATLEKFITRGFIRHFSDIFHLERHGEEIRSMEGFGEKSYKNLQDSIEKARTTTLPKLIYGLGIANIGLSNAKMCIRDRYQGGMFSGICDRF